MNTKSATDLMIARRMRQGYKLDETTALLDETFSWVGSADSLASALVYPDFATVRMAERFAAEFVPVGYVCKQCGRPSPVGIGYAASGWDASNASSGRTSCACGYSRQP